MQTSHDMAERISMAKASNRATGISRLAVGGSEYALGTRSYYDEHAQAYADATLPLPLNDAFDWFVARLGAGETVLDLGCGAGRDLRALSGHGLQAIGFDASRPLGKIAAEFSGCPVVQGDLRALPFDDGAFTGIWASASLLHLRRDEIPMALKEVSRVLRRGGYFFSSVKVGEGEGPDLRGRWFTYVKPAEWLAYLSQAGLTFIESNATHRVLGTLDTAAAVDWFACISRKVPTAGQ